MKALFKRSATMAIKRGGLKIVPASPGKIATISLENLEILGITAEDTSEKIKKWEKEYRQMRAIASAYTDAVRRNEMMKFAALLFEDITNLKKYLSRLYLHIADVMWFLQMKSASKNMRERSSKTIKAAASDAEKLKKLLEVLLGQLVPRDIAPTAPQRVHTATDSAEVTSKPYAVNVSNFSEKDNL